MQYFTTVTIPPSVLEGWLPMLEKSNHIWRYRYVRGWHGLNMAKHQVQTFLVNLQSSIPTTRLSGLLWIVTSYKRFCISFTKWFPVFFICRCFLFFSSEGANTCLANANLMKPTCFISAFKGLFKPPHFYSLFHFPLSPLKQSYKM